MREPAVDQEYLKRFTVHETPFWDACAKAFERMFHPPLHEKVDQFGLPRHSGHCLPDGLQKSEPSEIIGPGVMSDATWAWYVTQREAYLGSSSVHYDAHYFEKKLCDWFLGLQRRSTIKPILLIHGRTGIGKTTFVRYFFDCYLKAQHGAIASNTHVLRISMPSVARDPERAEDEFDHTVYKFLIGSFREGQLNLGDPDNLTEMASLEYEGDPKSRKTSVPMLRPPEDFGGQLAWVREKVVGRRPRNGTRRSQPVSDFADFNRLAIAYLSKINPDLRIVIVLDNVDHLSPDHQKGAWLLARNKLKWIETWTTVSFIITIRSYLLRNAWKEDTLRAYFTEQIELYPPSLYEVLAQRKKTDFDPLYPARSSASDETVAHVKMSISDRGAKQIEVPLYCPNELVSSLLDAFRGPETDRLLSHLSNFDLRQGSEMARTLLQYPFFDWRELADIVWQQWQGHRRRQRGDRLVNPERIIDALIRIKNCLCDPEKTFFDNIFTVDGNEHFSESLTKLFVLALVDRRVYEVSDLTERLVAMGHPRNTVSTALQTLLRCNIITSPQGIDLREHRLQLLHSKETTLCREYLSNLHRRLYYLQGFAYTTPMEAKFRKDVGLPTRILDDDRTFQDRVKSAAALYRQIMSDFEQQRLHVESLKGDLADLANNTMSELGFEDLRQSIVNGVVDDLRRIKHSGGFPSADWSALLKLFDE